MRIDDENKVVWCSEELLRIHKREIVHSTRYDMVFVAIKFYKRGTLDDFFETQLNFEEYLIAILHGYTFKLEQPQKYYWRKKREYLAWFEVAQDTYLAQDEDDGELTLGWLEGAGWKCKFTEQEARDLLKDDFDKFEKVECE